MIKRLLFKAFDKLKYSTLIELEKKLSNISQQIASKDVLLSQKMDSIRGKESEIDDLQKNVTTIKDTIETLSKNEVKTRESLSEIEKKFEDIKDYGPDIPGAYGLYEPKYNLNNSKQYKERLEIIRDRQKEMIKDKEAIDYANWTVNESKREGNKLVHRTVKLALRAFNGECDSIIMGVKHFSRYDTRKKRITNSFETINEMLSVLTMSIKYDYLQWKFEELDLVFEYEKKLQEEREAYAKQREIERDDELAKREYERELKRIEKEQNHFMNEMDKMKNELKLAALNEREKYELKIKLLLDKIESLENEKQEFKTRFENKAGYVYIISNIGSFGENIFKIGTTRRLDPFDRINELCNASVPFRYDAHAIIFSNNCYELEHELHNYFAVNRINRVNNYKEFFRIPLVDIEAFCKSKDPTVNFIYNPEGMEYKASRRIAEELAKERTN